MDNGGGTLGLELGAPPRAGAPPPELLLHLKGETFPARELIERNPYGLPLDLAKVPPNALMARYVDPVALTIRDRVASPRPSAAQYHVTPQPTLLPHHFPPPPPH